MITFYRQPEEPSHAALQAGIVMDISRNGETAKAYLKKPGYFMESDAIRSQKGYISAIQETDEYLRAIIHNTITKLDNTEELDRIKEVIALLRDHNNDFMTFNQHIMKSCVFAIWEKCDANEIHHHEDPGKCLFFSDYNKILTSIGDFLQNYNKPHSEECMTKLYNDLAASFNGSETEVPVPVVLKAFLAKEFGWTDDYMETLPQHKVQEYAAFYKQKQKAEEHAASGTIPPTGKSVVSISTDDARSQIEESKKRARKIRDGKKQ